MVRKKKSRFILSTPIWEKYSPNDYKRINGKVELLYEEYESLKLADFFMKNHEEAAELMNISRSTFARIYKAARCKMIKALVLGAEIVIKPDNSKINPQCQRCNFCNRTKINGQNNNKKCSF